MARTPRNPLDDNPLSISPDIDYPVSWAWHRHYCREFGKPDPGPDRLPEQRPAYACRLESKQCQGVCSLCDWAVPANAERVVVRTDDSQKVRAELAYLRNKLGELQERKKGQSDRTWRGGIPA